MGGVIRLPGPRVALLLKKKSILFTTRKFPGAKVVHIGCGELIRLPRRY